MKLLFLSLTLLVTLSSFAEGQKQAQDHGTSILVCSPANYSQNDIDRAVDHYLTAELGINENDIEDIYSMENMHFLPIKHAPLAVLSVFIGDPRCVVERHLKSLISITYNTDDHENDCDKKNLELELTMTDGMQGSGDFYSEISVSKQPECL